MIAFIFAMRYATKDKPAAQSAAGKELTAESQAPPFSTRFSKSRRSSVALMIGWGLAWMPVGLDPCGEELTGRTTRDLSPSSASSSGARSRLRLEPLPGFPTVRHTAA